MQHFRLIAEEAVVGIRPRFGPLLDFPEAVEVKLPLKARVLLVAEVGEQDLRRERLHVHDPEGGAGGIPRDDIGTLIRQNFVDFAGKYLRSAPLSRAGIPLLWLTTNRGRGVAFFIGRSSAHRPPHGTIYTAEEACSFGEFDEECSARDQRYIESMWKKK